MKGIEYISLTSSNHLNLLTVHGMFDRTIKKSEKLQKSVQKNRNINKKPKNRNVIYKSLPPDLMNSI